MWSYDKKSVDYDSNGYIAKIKIQTENAIFSTNETYVQRRVWPT